MDVHDDITLIHGGDTRGFFDHYGVTPLDFSANSNPLGVPCGVKRAICEAAENADRYPDPLCRELRVAISKSENIDPARIFCANGAAEIIYRLVLAQKPKRALVMSPTFAEYELALSSSGCEVMHHLLICENDFELTESILRKLCDDIDMVFLCNPNNPTGKTINTELMKAILRRCSEHDIFLIVDECFLGFTDKSERLSLTGMLSKYPKLIILKAFTKLYGMAGVRLGYCLCSDAVLLQRLYGAGQPWSVSTLAQQAGIAALSEHDYVMKSRALITEERKRVSKALVGLGCRVTIGEANYILFFSLLPRLGERLCEKGVLLRDCSNYVGLSEGYYRAAVRTQTENDRLILAINEIMEETK